MPYSPEHEVVAPPELPEASAPEAPDVETAYTTWNKSLRLPPDNASMLTALEPTITRAARTHVGNVNPLVRSKARQLALDALNTYQPDRGTRLQSHVFSHLQGLKRYVARTGSGVSVPERVALDRRAMQMAATDLEDNLGRPPTDDELAGHTGLSPKRMKYVRTYNPAMSEGFFSGLGADGGGFAPGVQKHESNAWLQLVYSDLSPLDKKIFEHTLGWNGQPALSNQAIASRLQRSPGWVSQRKLLIQQQIDQEQELSPFATER